MNKSKKELKPKLQNKLNDELKNYRTELLKDCKEEIFEHSYQTTTKEEIKNFIIEISSNLSINDLDALCHRYPQYISKFRSYRKACFPQRLIPLPYHRTF